MTDRHPATKIVAVSLVILLAFLASSAIGSALGPVDYTGGSPSSSVLISYQGGSAGFGGPAALVEVNQSGKVVWSVRESEVTSYLNAERWTLPDGRELIAAAYVRDETENCGRYEPPCARTGWRLYDQNASPQLIDQWDYAVPSSINSEVHDIEYLPKQDSVAVLGMDRERIIVVDRVSGKIEWEWSLGNVYERPKNVTERDWLHANDIDHIHQNPDRFLVSVRNSNQLFIVERQDEKGKLVEIINQDRGVAVDGHCVRGTDLLVDGKTRCGNPNILNKQHNPQWLGEGRVLVADSESDRVVELARRNGTWKPVWSVYRTGGTPFSWPRDADRLENGHTLITDTRNDRIVEIDEQGDLLWEFNNSDVEPYSATPVGEEPLGGPYLTGTGEQGISQPSTVVSRLHRTLTWAVRMPGWYSEWHTLAIVIWVILSIWAALWRSYDFIWEIVFRYRGVATHGIVVLLIVVSSVFGGVVIGSQAAVADHDDLPTQSTYYTAGDEAPVIEYTGTLSHSKGTDVQDRIQLDQSRVRLNFTARSGNDSRRLKAVWMEHYHKKVKDRGLYFESHTIRRHTVQHDGTRASPTVINGSAEFRLPRGENWIRIRAVGEDSARFHWLVIEVSDTDPPQATVSRTKLRDGWDRVQVDATDDVGLQVIDVYTNGKRSERVSGPGWHPKPEASVTFHIPSDRQAHVEVFDLTGKKTEPEIQRDTPTPTRVVETEWTSPTPVPDPEITPSTIVPTNTKTQSPEVADEPQNQTEAAETRGGPNWISILLFIGLVIGILLAVAWGSSVLRAPTATRRR
jgi:hypothetical protein